MAMRGGAGALRHWPKRRSDHYWHKFILVVWELTSGVEGGVKRGLVM